MFSAKRRKNLLSHSMRLVGLVVLFALATSSVTLAQDQPGYVRLVREMETADFGVPNPAGLAFSPAAEVLLVVEARGPAQPPAPVFDISRVTLVEDRVGSVRIAASITDPINVAFDSKAQRLLFLQSAKSNLFEVRVGSDGNPDPTTLRPYNARRFGLEEPRGMTVDPASGHLFFLDAAGPRLVRVEPEANGGFDNAVISAVDLQPAGVVNPRGLAWDPNTGHLQLLSLAEQTLYELTPAGQVVTTRNLSEFGLGNPQAMVFAPSGDLTDDPAEMSLYIADAGQDAQVVPAAAAQTSADGELSEAAAGASTQDAGAIVELTFVAPTAPAASSFASSLVRTTDMAAFSPPSPDPSGLAYLPSSNTLLMCDGEVEETVGGITHFAGVNVWEMTLGGNVVNTANISKVAPTVVPMTNEPTGVAWYPANGHFFFTDDNGKDVFDLNPGADGQYGTADDTWTSFDTLGVGSGDPEGIAYDSWHDRLFVADGVNMEVYQFTRAGSLVGQFDVERYGVVDPETVEFNSDSGTLFVLSSNRNSPVAIETTTSGDLLQTIDVSAANPRAAAGLAYAPASNGSGAKRFYIVDRGIDNNSDPNIIDGKMYEMTAPPGTPTTPTPGPSPTPTATPTPTDTPTPTSTPSSSDPIFADGFESGNLSAWTSSNTDGGDLSVSAAAALVGSNGLQAVIDDNITIFVTDDTPNAEPRYRVRFYFDPNSISMASGDNHFIFRGFSGTSTLVLRVQLRYRNGNYQLRAALRNDGSTWTQTSWLTIGDAPHVIELDWQAATAAGANDGGLTLWIDGVQQASLTGIDNDTRRIDRARLGAVAGIDTGTRGTYYFDAFESRRQTYIGP